MDVYKRTKGKLEGQWPPAVRFQHHNNLLMVEKIEDFTKEKGNYCTLPMTHSKMGINMKKVKEIGQVGALWDIDIIIFPCNFCIQVFEPNHVTPILGWIIGKW